MASSSSAPSPVATLTFDQALRKAGKKTLRSYSARRRLGGTVLRYDVESATDLPQQMVDFMPSFLKKKGHLGMATIRLAVGDATRFEQAFADAALKKPGLPINTASRATFEERAAGRPGGRRTPTVGPYGIVALNQDGLLLAPEHFAISGLFILGPSTMEAGDVEVVVREYEKTRYRGALLVPAKRCTPKAGDVERAPSVPAKRRLENLTLEDLFARIHALEGRVHALEGKRRAPDEDEDECEDDPAPRQEEEARPKKRARRPKKRARR